MNLRDWEMRMDRRLVNMSDIRFAFLMFTVGMLMLTAALTIVWNW